MVDAPCRAHTVKRNTTHLQSHPYYVKHRTSMGLPSPGAAAGAPSIARTPLISLIPLQVKGAGGIAGVMGVTGQQMQN